MPKAKINSGAPAKATETIEVMSGTGASLQPGPADVSSMPIPSLADIVDAPGSNQEAPVSSAAQGGDEELLEHTPNWAMMSKRGTVSLFEATCLALNIFPNSETVEELREDGDERVKQFNAYLNIVKDHNRTGRLGSAQPDKPTGLRSTRVKVRDLKEWIKSSGVFDDPVPPKELLNLKLLDQQAEITDSLPPRPDVKANTGSSPSLKMNAEVPPRIEKAAVSRIERSLFDIVLGLAISHYDFVPVGVPGGARKASDMQDVNERISEALADVGIKVSGAVIEKRLAEATARCQSLEDGIGPVMDAIKAANAVKAAKR